MPRTVFRPITNFVTAGPDGLKVRFGPDTLVPDGHWVLAGRESLFEPVEDAADRVEQATAAPGERRTTRRTPSTRRKKA